VSKTTSRTTKRERVLLAVSGGILTVALVAGLVMLFRARALHEEVDAAETSMELRERNSELRAQVAEMTALTGLTAFPRNQDSLDTFREILMLAAERFADDPLSGNPNAGAFACEAIEFSAGDGQIRLWTSGLIDEGIRGWALDAISEQLKTGTEGSRYLEEKSRIIGTSWAAFKVEGSVRVGALVWLTPRYP